MNTLFLGLPVQSAVLQTVTVLSMQLRVLSPEQGMGMVPAPVICGEKGLPDDGIIQEDALAKSKVAKSRGERLKFC